jgi:alpha-galactosidase
LEKENVMPLPQIELSAGKSLWSFGPEKIAMGAPAFEWEGRRVAFAGSRLKALGPWKPLNYGGLSERLFEAALKNGLRLRLQLRASDESPLLRFRYLLLSQRPSRLTRRRGRDDFEYFSVSLKKHPQVTEVRLGEFNELFHSYLLSERPLGARSAAMGPVLTASNATHSLLLAYEHGSTHPDAFLQFEFEASGRTALRAVKGNLWDGQAVSESRPFESPWMLVANLKGGPDALASAFRGYLLKQLSPNLASRKPRIFYNTWNYQERHKHWEGGKFLDPMRQKRMLQEIDIAGGMGIETFVLDTGWYQKTGDWEVNLKRFPDGLKEIRRRLKKRGMQLGLWFNPTVAALSSRMHRQHADCLMTKSGKAGAPGEIWETEKSQRLCLVSRYHEAFADELIRLHRELGVNYFKWDAIDQYGCDDPRHDHGGARNTAKERGDAFAFLLPKYMGLVVDKLAKACPDATVDFDLTEKDRCFGLQFLASGKFFLFNNGPYNFNLDLKSEIEPMGINMFVAPGPARAWFARRPLGFDKWIPSSMTLAHYMTDDPADSQDINLASLMLGQGGLWGDLPKVSPAGRSRTRKALDLYKKVRDDATLADPVVSGEVGGNPEFHEKLNPKNGRGLVAAFATQAGDYEYVTARKASRSFKAGPGAKLSFDKAGRARLRLRFEAPGAKLVFFGVK